MVNRPFMTCLYNIYKECPYVCNQQQTTLGIQVGAYAIMIILMLMIIIIIMIIVILITILKLCSTLQAIAV